MAVSVWFIRRRFDRRTRKWRFWWIRWGTCCGTLTPCWRSGNNGPHSTHFGFFFVFFLRRLSYRTVQAAFWKRPGEEGDFCWILNMGPSTSLNSQFSHISPKNFCYLFCVMLLVGKSYCHRINSNNLIHSQLQQHYSVVFRTRQLITRSLFAKCCTAFSLCVNAIRKRLLILCCLNNELTPALPQVKQQKSFLKTFYSYRFAPRCWLDTRQTWVHCR